jgi:hypothetical protein
MLHSNERIIKHKVGLLNLAEELGNVSKVCQMMGLWGSWKVAPDECCLQSYRDCFRR